MDIWDLNLFVTLYDKYGTSYSESEPNHRDK